MKSKSLHGSYAQLFVVLSSFLSCAAAGPAASAAPVPLARVCIADRCGYIDPKGVEVVRIEHAKLGEFDRSGFVRAETPAGVALYDTSGKTVLKPRHRALGPVSEGLLSFEKDGAHGYLDLAGKVVIPARYAEADPFHGGVARVVDAKSGRQQYVNRAGRVLYEPYSAKYPFELAFEAPSEGFTRVEVLWGDGRASPSGLFGYMDAKGDWAIRPQWIVGAYRNEFQMDFSFAQGRAIVRADDPIESWMFVDREGRPAPDTVFEKAQPFDKAGFARVSVFSPYPDQLEGDHRLYLDGSVRQVKDDTVYGYPVPRRSPHSQYGYVLISPTMDDPATPWVIPARFTEAEGFKEVPASDRSPGPLVEKLGFDDASLYQLFVEHFTRARARELPEGLKLKRVPLTGTTLSLELPEGAVVPAGARELFDELKCGDSESERVPCFRKRERAELAPMLWEVPFALPSPVPPRMKPVLRIVRLERREGLEGAELSALNGKLDDLFLSRALATGGDVFADGGITHGNSRLRMHPLLKDEVLPYQPLPVGERHASGRWGWTPVAAPMAAYSLAFTPTSPSITNLRTEEGRAFAKPTRNPRGRSADLRQRLAVFNAGGDTWFVSLVMDIDAPRSWRAAFDHVVESITHDTSAKLAPRLCSTDARGHANRESCSFECDLGHPVSCTLWGGSLSARGKKSEAVAMYERACELDADHCGTLADYFKRERRDAAAAKKVLAEACGRGSGATCVQAGNLVLAESRDLDGARGFFTRACELGTQGGCDGLKVLERWYGTKK